MHTRSLLIVLGSSALLAGCGSEQAESPPARTAASTSVATKTPSPASMPRPEGPAAVAEAYAHAVAAADWPAVCATRTPKDRADMAVTAGSCERAFELIFDGKPVTVMATIRAANVRVKGRFAGVDLVQPGQTEAFGRLGVVRVGGRWLLEDIPDSKIP